MGTQRFINKSALIEAVQFTGTNLDDINEFIEFTNIQSATILNNVLYIIAQVYGEVEFERWTLLPHDYLIKDASGYVTTMDEHIILKHWHPLNKEFLIPKN